MFNSLFRDAPKYGIVFIVTTTIQNAIRSRVAQNFINKVCLKMPNDTDYRDLLGAPKGQVPADNYGRGVVLTPDGNTYEFQTADMCNRDNKTKFIREYADTLVKKYGNKKVSGIAVLPEFVYIEYVAHELVELSHTYWYLNE